MKTPVHVLLTALLLAAPACSVYDSSLVEKGLAGLPLRPPPSTSSESDEVEEIFALRNV
ncbi:MAG: hypothetical protein WBN29_07485 [Polyangiales bacterium]